MKRFVYFLIFLVFFVLPARTDGVGLISRISGYILLDVESKGEAWYVYPKDKQRYFLGRPDDAFEIMRQKGLGITDADLKKIPLSGSDESGDLSLRKRLSGLILLQIESRGEAWYVYPKDLKRYYLGRPADAFKIMSQLGLGISKANLSLIPKPLDNGSFYERKTVATKNGDFIVDLITIDLSRPNVEILSDTASLADCQNQCPAKPLKDYIETHQGFAGIHGAYFCPPDYANCQNKINYYFYPFYNTKNQTLINAKEIAWLQGSILVFDKNKNHYFFPNGPDFISLADFESKHSTKAQTIISNSPALVYQGKNIVASQAMDEKQRATKGYRGGIGIKDKTVYLLIAHAATVPDLAAVMEAIGVETGLNLDGGGSSALYFNGQYKVGPGRLLPTAIVFKEDG